jgi:hypothetical protein
VEVPTAVFLLGLEGRFMSPLEGESQAFMGRFLGLCYNDG